VPHYNYTPLSAQDMDFLLWETPALQMHGSAVQIFDAGSLATPEGGVDVDTIRRAYAAVLHRMPRYRQKLEWVPGARQAAWVDDAHFNLDYHVRHVALPRPGTDEQLMRLGAQIMEQPLDRARPLWELWVIEGLEGNRFALISKTHHCMVDGASGMGMIELILSPTPDRAIPEAPRFVPRPAPTPQELRRALRRHRRKLPWHALAGLRNLAEEGDGLLSAAQVRLRALEEMTRFKLRPATDTPINGPVGPHRIFRWLDLPLDAVRSVKSACGCSVNDVVLGIVTGAMRDFMIVRLERPEDIDFRVATPVNVRRDSDKRPGNQVSSWVVPLPIGESDPLARLETIRKTTRDLKDSNQAAAVELVTAIHEWIPFNLQSLQVGTVNSFVTNVPGPPRTLYLAGARLLEIYAQAPLIEGLGVVVSVLSYDGRLFFGFNADYDRVPDLRELVAATRSSFETLVKAAGQEVPAAPRSATA
jgi:WS/DGAT/MGAT family acyltransferase